MTVRDRAQQRNVQIPLIRTTIPTIPTITVVPLTIALPLCPLAITHHLTSINNGRNDGGRGRQRITGTNIPVATTGVDVVHWVDRVIVAPSSEEVDSIVVVGVDCVGWCGAGYGGGIV